MSDHITSLTGESIFRGNKETSEISLHALFPSHLWVKSASEGPPPSLRRLLVTLKFLEICFSVWSSLSRIQKEWGALMPAEGFRFFQNCDQKMHLHWRWFCMYGQSPGSMVPTCFTNVYIGIRIIVCFKAMRKLGC